MASPKDRRLRGAVIFSLLCLIGVWFASRAFDVRLGPEEYDKAFAMLVPTLGLALASIMASWQLIGVLLDRRPAFGDRQGRWVWLWTLVFCTAFLTLGLANSASQTFGQVVLYGSGLLVALVGAIGLLISALPRWKRTAAPGR